MEALIFVTSFLGVPCLVMGLLAYAIWNMGD